MQSPAFGLGASPLPLDTRRSGLQRSCPPIAVARAGDTPSAPRAKPKSGGAVGGVLRALFGTKAAGKDVLEASPASAAPAPATSSAPVPSALRPPTPAKMSAPPFSIPPKPASKPLQTPPAPRDPRRVLVVGASGRLGREVVKALGASGTGFSVIGVVRSLTDAPEGCSQLLTLDVSTQAEFLASEVARLGVGCVVWCASAGPGSGAPPRDIDYAAVRTLSAALGDARVSGGGGGVTRGDSMQWLANSDCVVPLVQAANAFRPLNDVIMGGRSSSGVVDGGAEADGAPFVWRGNVVVAGGGFASVRADLRRNEFTPGVDLSSCEGVAVTCRGDGRTYKVNLRNAGDPEFVFQASFDTAESGEWATVRIPFSDFIPVKRGKIAYADNGKGVYAAQLATTDILSVGLVYSKIELGGGLCPRFTEGPFQLDLARIDAYRAATPRFVYVSSAAVTRPFWSEKKKVLYSSCANIPIVKLNPGNILGAKLAGEDCVRSSSIPYMVVRPTALVSDVAQGQAIRYSKGDFEVGRIHPADVATAIVHALSCEDAAFKTVELSGDPSGSWSDVAASSALLSLPMDGEQILYPGRVEEL